MAPLQKEIYRSVLSKLSFTRCSSRYSFLCRSEPRDLAQSRRRERDLVQGQQCSDEDEYEQRVDATTEVRGYPYATSSDRLMCPVGIGVCSIRT